MADDKVKLLPEIEQLTEKLLADPKSRVFAQLADAYRKCGMFDEAIDTAKKGLEIHPNYAVAHLILGRCYMTKKMYALAREEFELTIRNDPQNLVGYRLLAETYERQNMYPEAVKFYQMVLDLDPTNIDIAEKVDNLKGAVKREEPPRPQPAPQPATAPEPPAPPEPAPAAQPEAPSVSAMPEPTHQAPEITEPATPAPESISIEPVGQALTLSGESQAAPESTARETSISPEPAAPVPEEKAGEPSGTTVTLAELYATQGHFEKAVEAYRELIAAEPENEAYKARMDELLAKAFPELSPAPELELATVPDAAPEPAAIPQATAGEARPVEQQAVELTGMFAEMEKLAAVAEPAPPQTPEEAVMLDAAFPREAAAQTLEQEPAAAVLSALFAEEPQPAPPAPPPAAAPEPKKEQPAEAADEPKENAVSSFQAWLNNIQK
jgi:tetratricopeptide (TPR) repeat protein